MKYFSRKVYDYVVHFIFSKIIKHFSKPMRLTNFLFFFINSLNHVFTLLGNLTLMQ